MNLSIWAVLTIVAFVLVIVFTAIAAVFVARLVRRPTLPMSDALRTHVSGGDPDVHVYKPGHSDAQQRKLETASAEGITTGGCAGSERTGLIPGSPMSPGRRNDGLWCGSSSGGNAIRSQHHGGDRDGERK